VSHLNAIGGTTIFNARDFHLGSGLFLDGDQVVGRGWLSGEWFNGTNWSVEIYQIEPSARVRVVPEPATLALLALGGLALISRRKA
jgi:hypothetical protein